MMQNAWRALCLLLVLGSAVSQVRRKIIVTDKVPLPTTWFSQAVQVGDFLYVSGNLGMTTEGQLVEGIVNQTELALTNIGHILEAANTSFFNVVKVTVLLGNISYYNDMNEVYGRYFTSMYPARAAYAVANLPLGALVEIEAVAVVGNIIDDRSDVHEVEVGKD